MSDDEREAPTPAGLAARAQSRTVVPTAPQAVPAAPQSAPSTEPVAERAGLEPAPVEDASAARVTGDAAVDEALGVLDGLADRPLTEHVAAFDAVHSALQDRLAEAQG